MKPTWEDVGVPLTVVNSIKRLPACYFLDSLVYQLVYRNKRRATYIYYCDNCGKGYKPDRASEEITDCVECGCKKMRCAGTWRWGKDIPHYSRSFYNLNYLISAMQSNYHYYHAKTIELDCGWKTTKLYCQFSDGELATSLSPRICLIKAAILSPFLWDMSFNWTEMPNCDKINTDLISPIFHNFCLNSMRD